MGDRAEYKNGQTLRREATQALVLDACRQLMRGGMFAPPIALVAKLAGRSNRSVFQHFGDVERLHKMAIEDDFVFRAILTQATDGDVACLDWPPELQEAVVHAIVYKRPMPVSEAFS